MNLNQKLKDQKGNFFGQKIQCLVLTEDKQFAKHQNGEMIVVDYDDKKFEKVLKDVIEESLLSESAKNPLSGKDKMDRYRIWSKVNAAEETIDLVAEEISIIKACILEVQPILIAGQCDAMLEGK